MNHQVENNYQKLKPSLLYLPIILLTLIGIFLYKLDALNVDSYIQIQKQTFYFLNAKLSEFSLLQYNLTQLGDAFIILSLLTIFILKAPQMWAALIPASIISAILSKILKELFSVPRPAAILDHSSFTIIGRALPGTTSSLPSGHSITVFTVLTVLMYGFMPKNRIDKITWCLAIVSLGIILIFTRVAVGAHFPLDVIIGGIIGYISGLIGIFINKKYRLFRWVSQKKYYPFFIILFIASIAVIVSKISSKNLIVFYLSFISLMYSLYAIIKTYVKK